MESLQNTLQRNFCYMSRSLSGVESAVSDKAMSAFIRKLKKTSDVRLLGDWFAWYYVAYQFMWWSDKVRLSRSNGKYPATWIFGDKAIERWNQRNDSWQYWTDKFVEEHELTRPVEYCKADVEGLWEGERKRFYNTDLGFLTCQASSLYEEKSPTCITCKNRSLCASAKSR